MASKTKKTREAKVRASRAKSRVVARRKSRAESAKRESREKIAATYAMARERLSSHTTKETDGAAAAIDKKVTGQDETTARSKKERGRKSRPAAPERQEAAKKDGGRKEGDSSKRRKRGQKAPDETSHVAFPVPVAKEESKKTYKAKKEDSAKKRLFHKKVKDQRRRQLAEKESARDEVSMRRGARGPAAEGEKKNRRGETRISRIAVLSSLLVISLGALLWVYTGTGVLNVKSVEVRGNEKLDEAYLRTLSGITQQSHLLKLDVGAVERALLSEPYIAAVDVSRSFPNKVVLEITERRPVAFILQNGVYSLVDKEGMILESVEDRPQGLVEIKDLDLPLLIPGSAISSADFAAVNSLLASLPPSLQEMTATAGYIEGEGLYIESGNTVVIYGEASELTYKNTIALLALTNLMDHYRAVEYIDVSFPDNPVIKPVGS